LADHFMPPTIGHLDSELKKAILRALLSGRKARVFEGPTGVQE
jgi:hypothetical protein